MNVAPLPRPAPDDLLEQLLEQVLSEVRLLRGEVAEVKQMVARGRGPRDDVDVRLIGLIAAISPEGVRATCAEVFRHAQVDPVLRDTLEDAQIDNPQQLGKLLRSLAGTAVNGIHIERTDEPDREGVVWRLTRKWRE